MGFIIFNIIMRKISILFLMLLMMALTPSMASAGRYSSLKFTSESGETYTVATENLEILIQGANLTFSNTNLIIPVSYLVSMEFGNFDDSSSEVNSAVADQNGVVSVFDINGTLLGSFGSYSEALGSLTPGIYVIMDSNGNSLKVSVGK